MARRRTMSRTIVTEQWGCPVHVVAGATMADALRAARRRFRGANFDGLHDGLLGCCGDLADEAGLYVLFPAGASPGTVAHELYHATVRVLRRAGVPITHQNDETAAYALDRLVDEVAPWLDRVRARLRDCASAK